MTRPAIVTIAIILLAISFVYDFASQLYISGLLGKQGIGVSIARLLLPLAILLAKCGLLVAVARGRNWARVVVMLIVALGVALAMAVLVGPFAGVLGQLVLTVPFQVIVEVSAVVMLMLGGGFFVAGARTGPKHNGAG